MLQVQEYLKTHTFGELIAEHAIYPSFNKSFTKFSLNYDQIDSKDSDPLVQESRGLVLSAVDFSPYKLVEVNKKLQYQDIVPGETVIQAHAFNRFFNYGQGAAAKINWNDPKLRVFEKYDGTLGIVSCHFDGWHVSTRSVPEADLMMDNQIFTFRTLFEKGLKDSTGMNFEELTSHLNPDVTYMFEITSPLNTIIVKYPSYQVVLLGARYKGGNEINIDDINIPGVLKAVYYNLGSIEAVKDYVDGRSAIEHEGVVVVDSNFNRVKVKNPEYLTYSKASTSLSSSPRNCLQLVLSGNVDDYIPLMPDVISERLILIKEKLSNYIRKYEEVYNSIYSEAEGKSPGDRKEFALTVKRYGVKLTSPMYLIYQGKFSSVRDYFSRDTNNWSDSMLDALLTEIGL